MTTSLSVNYAFAYIDQGSLQIVTMDAATEASLFSDTTNIKVVKPDLKVFVSVGGWYVISKALYDKPRILMKPCTGLSQTTERYATW